MKGSATGTVDFKTKIKDEFSLRLIFFDSSVMI
jgi:hypothetical protein